MERRRISQFRSSQRLAGALGCAVACWVVSWGCVTVWWFYGGGFVAGLGAKKK